MNSIIIAQSFDIEEVGKTFKSSKKRFTWKVQMDKSTHTIQLFASFLSGKRKIVHNGNAVYQGKKGVGKDFSFPFNIGKNLVFIYEIGDSYSMKINNIEFSQFTGGNPSQSSSSFSSSSNKNYLEPSLKGYDQYENYNKPRSQTTSNNPKPKSGWDDVKTASNQARNSISSTNNYVEKTNTKYSSNDYVEKPNTKYSNTTNSTNQQNQQKKQSDDSSDDEPVDFLDLASEFNKFDYKDGGKPSNTNTNTNSLSTQPTKSKSQPTSNPQVNSRPSFTSTQDSPFDSHQNIITNTRSPQPPTKQVIQQKEDKKENKIDFNNFGDFGNPSQSQNVKKTAFDGFGGFDNFTNSQPSTKPTVQQTQPTTQTSKVTNQDLFGLDFGGGSSQPIQSKQNSAFDTTDTPPKLYGYDGYDSVYQPNKNTNLGNFNQNSNIGNSDLFGLDYSQTPQQQQSFQQPSYQQSSYQQSSYQQPSNQQTKKTQGWNSDLMTLDINGLDNAKNMTSNTSNTNQFGGGFGGGNSYGNTNPSSNPFNTNNMGYSTQSYSNPNQGGYGGLFEGTSGSSFGGGSNNYGGSNLGGGNQFGGNNQYGGNNNFGGNQGFGNVNNQYSGNGGFSNQGFGQNQYGGGFQNNNQVPVTNNKVSTPFDDDF